MNLLVYLVWKLKYEWRRLTLSLDERVERVIDKLKYPVQRDAWLAYYEFYRELREKGELRLANKLGNALISENVFVVPSSLWQMAYPDACECYDLSYYIDKIEKDLGYSKKLDKQNL